MSNLYNKAEGHIGLKGKKPILVFRVIVRALWNYSNFWQFAAQKISMYYEKYFLRINAVMFGYVKPLPLYNYLLMTLKKC